MTDPPGDLDRRVAAVERALTDGDAAVADLADAADLTARVDAVEDRLDALEARADDLDAATQALRGYVGGVRAVNRDVERRADLALAAASATREAVEGDPASDLDLPDPGLATDDALDGVQTGGPADATGEGAPPEEPADATGHCTRTDNDGDVDLAARLRDLW